MTLFWTHLSQRPRHTIVLESRTDIHPQAIITTFYARSKSGNLPIHVTHTKTKTIELNSNLRRKKKEHLGMLFYSYTNLFILLHYLLSNNGTDVTHYRKICLGKIINEQNSFKKTCLCFLVSQKNRYAFVLIILTHVWKPPGLVVSHSEWMWSLFEATSIYVYVKHSLGGGVDIAWLQFGTYASFDVWTFIFMEIACCISLKSFNQPKWYTFHVHRSTRDKYINITMHNIIFFVKT